MGNFNVSIRGVGQHHNKSPNDVERLAGDFVRKLQAAGHAIISAEVTIGGVEVLVDGTYGNGNLTPQTEPSESQSA